MQRALALFVMLAFASCAAEDHSPQPESASSIESRDQAVGLPWYPGEAFNEVCTNCGPGQLWATTRPSFWLTLAQPNTEYFAKRTLYNNTGSSYWFGTVHWSIHFWGYNMCVTPGCTFYLCMENLNRGYGTCDQVQGQGTTSSNPNLYGSTDWFVGLRHFPYETIRWTMAIQTSSYFPYPGYVDDFSIVINEDV